MKRNAISVSPNELRSLADDLESQTRQFNTELGIDEIIGFDKRWSVGIINKDEMCDTWEFE